jgi:hypothetical protein
MIAEEIEAAFDSTKEIVRCMSPDWPEAAVRRGAAICLESGAKPTRRAHDEQLTHCLSMIFSENGVSTFRDHALGAAGATGERVEEEIDGGNPAVPGEDEIGTDIGFHAHVAR